MVLAHYVLEFNTFGTLVLAQQLHRCGACGGGHGLAVQVLDILDTRVLAGGNAHLLDIGGVGKVHVLLTVHVIGGRAALDVHRTVDHQRNTVLRGHRLVFLVNLLAQLLFQIRNNVLGHFGVEAHVLAITQGIAQCARRLAHPQRDAARRIDLGQRVIGLRHCATCRQSHHRYRQQMFLHRVLL